MSKILITIILCFQFTQVFADCRETLKDDYIGIEEDLQSRAMQYAYIGPVIGVPLVFIFAPAGVGFISMLGGDYITRKLTIKERKKLIAAADEAYTYVQTSEAGKLLKKIHRKVNRKMDHKVEIADIANAIIDANENGDLCKQGTSNIRSQSKRIAVELSGL